ncbi:MAG: c-type cytochrome [Woeseiaceae bacterium]|nr:c-type cytochrome [Woeseiaceae bacterium]
MSSNENKDQKFFDMYSLVIGGLVVFAVFILILAMNISEQTQAVYVRGGAEYQAAVSERIRPLGEVYLPGEEQQAEAPTVTAVEEPEPVATTMSGPDVYNQACLACHATGAGGAPIVGDAGAWTARIAQGNDVLYDHAINGFTGEAGVMLPKGGRLDLSDDAVKAAVDYMVAESQ